MKNAFFIIPTISKSGFVSGIQYSKKPISILLKRIKASFDELKVNIKAKNFFV